MKAIGFNMQQRGDLIMNTVAAQSLIELYPYCHLTFGIAKPYEDMLPLFLNHPYIHDIHVWDSDDGLNKNDLDYINFIKYDKVFDPMPKHTYDLWFLNNLVKSQADEVCLMHKLPILKKPQCFLNKWFECPDLKKYIAFFPFAGFYNKNNTKRLSEIKAQSIVNDLTKLGYSVIQLGGSNEPKLENVIKLNTSYFESVKILLGCKFALGTDSGFAWLCSAYNFPLIGLYSSAYYKYENINYISKIQPINLNAIYLDEENVNDIPNETIMNKVKKIHE